MYDSHNIATAIKETAKQKNILLKKMLSDCELGSNTMSSMYHGKAIASDSIAKIADYLDCSVDYLLGRAKMPDAIFSGSADTENTDYIMTADLRETMLLLDYRNLNKQGKEYILQTMDLTKSRYEKKCDSMSELENIG